MDTRFCEGKTMVRFDTDPETKEVLVTVRAFVQDEVLPLQERYRHLLDHESAGIQPDGTLHPELVHASRELRRRSGKAGLYGLHMPVEVGGGGASALTTLAAYEEVYRHGMGFTLAVLASIEGPSRMLMALNDEQRRRYLEPLIRGEKTTCFALTEPGAGSDVRSIQGTAVKDGDDWVLNGTKMFITNGPYADFAQVFMRTPEDGPDSITAFLVDKGTPGFTVGAVNETIANNGLPCELQFQDCRVPDAHVIGAVGVGFYHALENINDTRIQIGGMSLGLAQYCLDKTLAYVKERQAFGRPISKYQGVTFPLADGLTEHLAARLIAQYAAWKIDQGEMPIEETSMTKLYTTEMLWRVADQCLQAHGGVGTLRQTGIERVLRWARIMRVFEGTSEIQRQTILKGRGL